MVEMTFRQVVAGVTRPIVAATYIYTYIYVYMYVCRYKYIASDRTATSLNREILAWMFRTCAEAAQITSSKVVSDGVLYDGKRPRVLPQ